MFCCLLSMFIHGLSPVWLVNLHVWWMSSQLGGIHISGLPILFMMPGLVLRKQGVLYIEHFCCQTHDLLYPVCSMHRQCIAHVPAFGQSIWMFDGLNAGKYSIEETLFLVYVPFNILQPNHIDMTLRGRSVKLQRPEVRAAFQHLCPLGGNKIKECKFISPGCCWGMWAGAFVPSVIQWSFWISGFPWWMLNLHTGIRELRFDPMLHSVLLAFNTCHVPCMRLRWRAHFSSLGMASLL